MCQNGVFTICLSLVHDVSDKLKSARTYCWSHLLTNSGNLVTHLIYINKGLHSALLDSEQENTELKMADPIWLPLKYNSILMLHKFSIWVCTLITYTWIRRMEQTKIVHQEGIATIVIQLNIT